MAWRWWNSAPSSIAEPDVSPDHRAHPCRVLILEARFYDRVIDLQVQGVIAALAQDDVDFRRVVVPGVLELPAALAMAVSAQDQDPSGGRGGAGYDGFIALGCVIRGASDHYDHVCREAMTGLREISTDHQLALGNGILTVHSMDQALERADPQRLNIGGLTARACLKMIALKKELYQTP